MSPGWTEGNWGERGDLNPRPSEPQSDALPLSYAHRRRFRILQQKSDSAQKYAGRTFRRPRAPGGYLCSARSPNCRASSRFSARAANQNRKITTGMIRIIKAFPSARNVPNSATLAPT